MTRVNIMSENTKSFRYQTQIPIRYRDMDTLGHVNNVVYLSYIEQSRIEYFADLELWDGDANELGLILAKSIVSYRAPLTMHDKIVQIDTRISRLGNKSFDMEHQLSCVRDEEIIIIADAQIVMVVFDYISNQTIVIPDVWRKRIAEYEESLKN